MVASVSFGMFRPNVLRGPNNIAIACVPKVAHSAIKVAVLESYGLGPFDGAKGWKKHRRHPMLRLCHPSSKSLKKCTVFAFTRHPLERLKSLWANRVLIGRKSFLRRAGRIKEGMPFEDFVLKAMTSMLVADDNHARTQSSCIPKNAKVFDYSQLDEAWKEIQKTWRLPDLKPANVSAQKPGTVSSEVMQKCRELYAVDYERFGYE